MEHNCMTTYNDQLSQYNANLFAIHDEALRRAWEDSPKLGLPAISVKPEEGRFLQVLVRAIGARKAVEIGTLGGYSGIWIARGLLPGGKLFTLELEPRHADIARQHFALAGVDQIVEIRLGNANKSLQQLSSEGPFDFVFIDADKPGYPSYYEWAMENVRLGGVVATHNAFRKGSVAGVVKPDEFTQMMDAYNRRIASDPRLISVIFPAGDGTLISVKTG
jgi:caffeoyl-CoA O-methyltransferase